MSITVTERASKRIEEIRENGSIAKDVPLRVSVESGGCSGLTYKLDFDKKGEAPEPTEGDQRFEVNGLVIVVDMRSFLYLAGTELDYTEGLEGQGFHFANPNAARTCSCGESFSL